MVEKKKKAADRKKNMINKYGSKGGKTNKIPIPSTKTSSPKSLFNAIYPSINTNLKFQKGRQEDLLSQSMNVEEEKVQK